MDKLIDSKIDEVMRITIKKTIDRLGKEKFKVKCPECGKEFEFEMIYKIKR